MTGDDTRHDAEPRGRERLAPALQIPKNRSTGNLAVASDSSEKARIRFSFDAGAAAAEYDAMSRSASLRLGSAGSGHCCFIATADMAPFLGAPS
jgi:protein-serine/threonine kinase